MEHYKILGVDKNASMEEITKAYEDRINKFKEEIEDEKRAKSFIKVFDEAYEKIKEEREQNQQTVIIDNQVKDLNNNFHKNDSNSYESFNEYEQESTVSKEKKRSSSKNTSIRKKRSKKKSTEDRGNIKSEKQSKRDSSRKAGSNKKSSESSITQLPLKILLMPVVVILNIISWIASKIIIIAAIAISAIHGYQIYIGHAIKYKIFVLCAVGFVVSLFLPSILKILVSTLSKVNSKLKKFVY